jgi:hypothetical protein
MSFNCFSTRVSKIPTRSVVEFVRKECIDKDSEFLSLKDQEG